MTQNVKAPAPGRRREPPGRGLSRGEVPPRRTPSPPGRERSRCGHLSPGTSQTRPGRYVGQRCRRTRHPVQGCGLMPRPVMIFTGSPSRSASGPYCQKILHAEGVRLSTQESHTLAFGAPGKLSSTRGAAAQDRPWPVRRVGVIPQQHLRAAPHRRRTYPGLGAPLAVAARDGPSVPDPRRATAAMPIRGVIGAGRGQRGRSRARSGCLVGAVSSGQATSHNRLTDCGTAPDLDACAGHPADPDPRLKLPAHWPDTPH